jgi:L-threonylcarbamoyladenylate synthase
MKVLRLEEPRALEKAIETLQHGGVVAFPTDTVYGIGASLNHQAALERIYLLKGRDLSRPLPLLLGSPSALNQVATDVDPRLLDLARSYWPGPLTVAFPAVDGLPSPVLAPDGTVGVRVPDHSVALALAQRAGGALAVTSANISGEAPALRPEEIDPELAGKLDLILDGGIAREGKASTVVSLDGATITIVREGAIPAATILDTWSRIAKAAATVARSTSAGSVE